SRCERDAGSCRCFDPAGYEDRPSPESIGTRPRAELLRKSGRIGAALQGSFSTGSGAGLEFNAVDAIHMLGIATKTEESLRWNEGYTEEEIGECLLLIARQAEASPHFARAWKLLHEDPWLSRDEPKRLERIMSLGQVNESKPEAGSISTCKI